MNNKIIIAVVIVAVVIVGGYFLLKSPAYKAPAPTAQAPVTETPSAPTTETPSRETVPAPTTQAPAKEIPLPGSTGQVPSGPNVVTYMNSGYSPSTLRVKVGATVVFHNNSSQSMWTASAFHPTHTAYPTTGGCIGSTFDACKGIQPGDSWSFKFDIAGTWKYHNHLNPSDTGTIIVE